MYIGHIVSGFLLRQMEFDADRHEARLAGSAVFQSTVRRLMELNVASQGAFVDLSGFLQRRRLADNVPRLILANVDQIPNNVRRQMGRVIKESRTGLLDTHPADKDRIANAERENAPGVFHGEGPASDLFVHYDALCKNVTWDFYSVIFGPGVKPADLHPLDELLEEATA